MTEEQQEKRTLLDAEARGGDTAESGFSFQEAFMLVSLPGWMARDGFTMAMREGMDDCEAAFFAPGQGLKREVAQVKAERITPGPFWEIVERFRRLDRENPGTFQWFTVVCLEVSEDLKPLVNGLRRLRDPYGFYDQGSGIIEASEQAFQEVVKKLGKGKDDASFLFQRVAIIASGVSQSESNGVFRSRLEQWLPEYGNYPATAGNSVYQQMASIVRSRKAQPIKRAELDAIVNACRSEGGGGVRRCRMHTVGTGTPGPTGAVTFEWSRFFGGVERQFPAENEWRQLVEELRETRAWILHHGVAKRIQLTGERRLSAALALGSTFNAVGGFVVEMVHRGNTWATDQHAKADTPSVKPRVVKSDGKGDALVISIGVGRDIKDDVQRYVEKTALQGLPALHLWIAEAIQNEEHANAAAMALKESIAAQTKGAGAMRMHLFFAGPSHLALFLGHRLNTIGELQCYEWVGPSGYVPTCCLSCH